MDHVNAPLLDVQNLGAYIPTARGIIRPVDGVSFQVREGEVVALVGESGSGKSVTAMSILRLNAKVIRYTPESRILYKGNDLLSLKDREIRKIRGAEISMIFQDPMFSLNPVHRIGRQIAESLIIHRGMKPKEALEMALDLLNKVGIPDAKNRINNYPHQLSGGMRQRVMIALALACRPKLIIADEPTTALDVSIQAQILDLLRELQREHNLSILLITHDLGVVAETADRVLVMYCGKIVEEGTVETIFRRPQHPYTKGLIESVPRLHGPIGKRLHAIPGTVPNPLELPEGCKFVTRCGYASEQCAWREPALAELGLESRAACWHPLNLQGGTASENGTARIHLER